MEMAAANRKKESMGWAGIHIIQGAASAGIMKWIMSTIEDGCLAGCM